MTKHLFCLRALVSRDIKGHSMTKLLFCLQALVLRDISGHSERREFRGPNGDGGQSSARHPPRSPRSQTVPANLAQVAKWGHRGKFRLNENLALRAKYC